MWLPTQQKDSTHVPQSRSSSCKHTACRHALTHATTTVLTAAPSELSRTGTSTYMRDTVYGRHHQSWQVGTSSESGYPAMQARWARDRRHRQQRHSTCCGTRKVGGARARKLCYSCQRPPGAASRRAPSWGVLMCCVASCVRAFCKCSMSIRARCRVRVPSHECFRMS